MPKPVFLALPDYNAGDLDHLEGLMRVLHASTGGALGHRHVYVPHLAVGDPGIDVEEEKWVKRVLAALQEARVVVAVLDGRQVDDAVAWVMGHAHARGVPVVGLWTDRRQVPHPLLTETCASVTSEPRELAGLLAPHLGLE